MSTKGIYGTQLLLLSLVLSLGLVVACNKAPNDAKLTSDVQNQIQADSSITSKQQIAVQSNNGVVTLSGTVASDAERSLAAIDASKVNGVKTVVNNLQTAPPAVAETPAPALEEQTPPPAPEKKERRHSKPSAERRHPKDQQAAPPMPVVADNQPPAQQQQTAPPPPPTPPPVQKVTIPDGTQLSIRLVEALDSGRNHAGDVFHGSLSQPIVVDGKVVIPADSDVTGQVTDAKDAGHFSGNSSLALKLTTLTVNGKTYQIATDSLQKQGKGRGKNTAEKVGGGAAIGALIGGLIGGGKGAAIGAGVGAGGGTAAQAATHGEQVKYPSESILNFRLAESLTVTPVKIHKRNVDTNSNLDMSNSDTPPTLERHE
ncbi:MAG TPA: BON domain-containing protein [Terriglobales bacterium]|nr:BON domain-containing protein [Terriglobales bacterium]